MDPRGLRKCSTRQFVTTPEERYEREDSRGEYGRELRGQDVAAQSDSPKAGEKANHQDRIVWTRNLYNEHCC